MDQHEAVKEEIKIIKSLVASEDYEKNGRDIALIFEMHNLRKYREDVF